MLRGAARGWEAFLFGTSSDSDLHSLALDHLATTADTARAAGSNETDLLAGGSIAANGRGVTNVLVVTTTYKTKHSQYARSQRTNSKQDTPWGCSTGFMQTPLT